MTRKRRSRPKSAAEVRRTPATGLEIESHRHMGLLSLATLVPMSLIFAPIELWLLSFVCLVPWLLLVGGSLHAPRVYFHSYVLGSAFFLINLFWLYHSTGPGYVALSLYLALYFPLVALPVRHAVRRRRWPLAIVFPLVWVGSEMLRAVVVSGFPWFFLSHSVYRVLTLIQVSDLVGAYGVTFMIAAVNGALADVALAWAKSRRDGSSLRSTQAIRLSTPFAAVTLLLVIVYGQIQLRRDTVSPGPRVAVIQGDFLSLVNAKDATGHDSMSEGQKMRAYVSMMEAAAAEKPDLYLLPESPWMMVLNPEARDFLPLSRRSHAALQEHATKHDATIVTGSATILPTPFDPGSAERRHNSATVFYADGSQPDRYDKVHLVYFGEIIPFRFGRLRFLYFWLNRLAPWSGQDGSFEFSLFPGESFKTFTMTAPSQGGRTYDFGIPICYEDVMPYVSREFVSGGAKRKRVDLLLNISNDGWFGRGFQQPQHLAICAFRAVENRVPIARAVNTGVSGFIKTSGQIHDLVKGDPDTPWPGECGFSVAELSVDSRYTLYSRYGDWFAWGCALLWLALFIDYWVLRARTVSES